MRTIIRCIALFGLISVISCEGATDPARPRAVNARADLSEGEPGNGLTIGLVGHTEVIRTIGDVTAPTTFKYSAVVHVDGKTSGHYYYNFRAAGFSIRGTITCVSTAGNEAWVGGIIDEITSADPADQALVGTEIWWRAQDNGAAEASPPDLTTSLLFAIPTLPITAASWCRDQNVRGFMFPIDEGDVKLR